MQSLSRFLGDKRLFKALKIFSNHNLLLFLLFVIILSSRLILAYNTETFTYDSYGDLRQINQIRDYGFHLVNDDLSYGGRSLIVLPFFHYVIGLISIVFPLSLVLKLLPNIFVSSIVFMIYLIILRINNNKNAALFGAFVGGFTPVLFSETFTSLSPDTLLIPLIFLFLYSFMRLNNKKHIYLFIFLSVIIPFTSLFSIILILTLLIYLIFSKVENFKFTKRAIELTIFFSFFTIWSSLIIFKKAFIEYGPNIISPAVPKSIYSHYFQDLTFGQLFGGVGLLSLVIGTYIIYNYLFNYKEKGVYLFTSLIISSFIFMWFNFIETSLGLMIIAVTLSIFVGMYYDIFFRYLKKTTFFRMKTIFVYLFIGLFMINSVFFSFVLSSNTEVVQKGEIRAMEWANKNTPKDSTIIAPIEFGNLITSVAMRKNIIDTKFMLAPDKNVRLESIDIIYFSKYYLYPLREIDKYGGDYLLIPQGENLDYLNDECFNLVYNKNVKIYRIECGVV